MTSDLYQVRSNIMPSCLPRISSPPSLPSCVRLAAGAHSSLNFLVRSTACDALPWLFKRAKLGTLVGKRTWGGLVGISEIPVLMDGGRVTSPSVAFFTPQGEWEVENHGVDPDVAVEQDPKAVSDGHDPQLEAAVAIALRELAAHPAAPPARPPFPNYHR